MFVFSTRVGWRFLLLEPGRYRAEGAAEPDTVFVGVQHSVPSERTGGLAHGPDGMVVHILLSRVLAFLHCVHPCQTAY